MRAIVGFDPGVTSGVAVLSLEGETIFLGSFRNSRLEEIVEKISNIAQPLIVATDVSPPSNSASRLARMFGATLYYPTISMTVAEKQSMTSGAGVEDLHQRDALASALAAYKTYRPMIEKIRQKSGAKYSIVLEKILKGEAPKIEDALIEKIKPVMPPKPSSMRAQLQMMKLNRDYLARKVEQLTQSNSELNAKLKEAGQELEKSMAETYRHVATDKKVKALEVQLHNIQSNERVVFQRTKLAEGKLEAIEKWLAAREGLLLRVMREGEGLGIGEFILTEDAREKLERIIKEHRSGKS